MQPIQPACEADSDALHHACTQCWHRCRVHPTALGIKAGCELFLRYTTRTSALELTDFQAAKSRLIEVRGHACTARGVHSPPTAAATEPGACMRWRWR